jgi:REP element-mobilizing transposase RayT
MARGIERRKIFRDDKDRKSFLERFAIILEETQTQCYAWSLIPNHFHLLLRTGPTPLSKVMRRLMTGYAVTFNKRHKRSGHLFQNRYKSVVCEEDPYLLELIRYIHLNPLRAGVIKDLKELDKYPWSGHSAILDRRKNPLIPNAKNRKNPRNLRNLRIKKSLAEKTIEDVLLFFSSKTGEARRKYREFAKKGVDQGSRPELQGGGLVRSAGGNKAALLGRKKDEREKGDERILGSGDFVTGILKTAGESFEMQSEEKLSLDLIIDTVTKHMGVTVEDLKSSSRKRKVVHARSIVTYAAVRGSGYKGSEVAEVLSLSRPTISACVEKGKIFLDNNKALRLELSIT